MPIRCKPRFRHLLAHFDDALLESQEVSACGLWPDFSIAYLSPGWLAFSAANGGEPAVSQRWDLGANLLTGISGPLRQFYEKHLAECFTTGCPWQHNYRCSSADKSRWYEMTVYPLESAEGLLIVHTLRVEEPQPLAGDSPTLSIEQYQDDNGIIHQCSYCRRVQRNSAAEAWDWVRALVEKPHSAVSHGICPACFGYYSPRLDLGESMPTIKRACQPTR